jgi:hypothetical protein
MMGIQTEATTDEGGGTNVGWINPNDWLDYTINFASPGVYTLKLRAATPNGPDVCKILVDNLDAATMNIVNTGDWQNWQTFETTINIASSGNHVIRLLAQTDGFNINWFELCGGGQASNCNLLASNGDYSVEVSTDANNPSLTFIPTSTGTGNSLCLLFYGTSSTGPYPANLAMPNVPFTINASAGQTVYFYYTYSLASGGENNSAANKNSFVVGQCGSTLKQADIVASTSLETNSVKVYPNPVSNILYIEQDASAFSTMQLIDFTGKTVFTHKVESDNPKLMINLSNYDSGIYILHLSNRDSVKTFKILKE